VIYKQPKLFILLEKSIPMGLIPSIRTIKGPHKTFRAIRYISTHPDRVNIITRDKINVDAIKPNKKTGIKWFCGVKVDEIAHIVDFKEPTETGLTRCVVKIDGKIGGKKYTDSKKERQAKIKWARLRHMEKNIATIRAKYEPLIGDANLTKKSFGIAMWCVDKAVPCLRIGGSAGNRADHFGTVTLQCKHIVQGEDGKVSIVFIGKSGVDWGVKINDPNIAEAILELKGNRDPEAKLLYDVERMDVIKWLSKFRVTAKDFRTYHASESFIELIKQYIIPTKRKDQNAILKSVFIEVAKKLNNTPNVCRSKYVLPSLIEHWLSGGKF